MVEYGEAVSHRVCVSFGAVAVDYVACRSASELLCKVWYSFVFGESLSRSLYLHVVSKPLWYEPWPLDLGGAG